MAAKGSIQGLAAQNPWNTAGSFRHMGEGDCVDAEGQRLAGLQKLGPGRDFDGRLALGARSFFGDRKESKHAPAWKDSKTLPTRRMHY